jgi:hypothetical protein
MEEAELDPTVMVEGEGRHQGFYQIPMVAVEANCFVFPVFLLSSGPGGRKGWYSYKRTILHAPADGMPQSIEQEWIVTGSHRLGLPRAVDMDVCMALFEIAQRRGGIPDDGRVEFSIHELREILGWRDNGEAYRYLRESIERTASSSITSRKAFWNPKRGSFVSKTFPLWKSGLRQHWDIEGRTSESSHVAFDDLIVESFKEGHLSRLDSKFYWALENSTSKRLYMLLDHHCSGEEGKARPWAIEPMELMRLMPLGNYNRASKVEQVLERAHAELRGAGYIKELEVERGRRNAPLSFRYEVSGAFARKRLGAVIERDPAGAIALEKLMRETVSREVAVRLIAEHGPDYCGRYADLLPLVAKKKRGQRAGYLVAGIRNGWPWEERVARLPKNTALSATPGVPDPPPDVGATRTRSAAAQRRQEGYEWLFGEGL